jgi:phage shock protein A
MGLFSRIGNLVKGFVNLFISNVERNNPKALLANIEENLRTDIAKFNQGLIQQATVIEKLKSQVTQQTRDQADLRARATVLIRAGKTDGARDAAFQLEKITKDLENNKSQLEAANESYNGFVKMRDQAVKQAKERIEKIKSNISETDRNKALSGITEMANSMNLETNSHGEQLARLDEIADNARAESAARLKVAQGQVDFSKIDEIEKQDEALKDNALADFMAREGISLPGTTAPVATAETPVKTIG